MPKCHVFDWWKAHVTSDFHRLIIVKVKTAFIEEGDSRMCVSVDDCDLSQRTTHLVDLFGRPQPSSVIVCAPCLTISDV